MTEQTAQHVRFAVSKAGHDKGTLYCVTGETPDAYFLSDGKTRKVARPKKKNRKHVQLIIHIPEEIRQMCLQCGAFYDEGIRYALKTWSNARSDRGGADRPVGEESECQKQTR